MRFPILPIKYRIPTIKLKKYLPIISIVFLFLLLFIKIDLILIISNVFLMEFVCLYMYLAAHIRQKYIFLDVFLYNNKAVICNHKGKIVRTVSYDSIKTMRTVSLKTGFWGGIYMRPVMEKYICLSFDGSQPDTDELYTELRKDPHFFLMAYDDTAWNLLKTYLKTAEIMKP